MLVLAALLIVSTGTACGPDLGRQNFPRTTVTASAAADGPITDEAVSFATLRTIDPCALLGSQALADLGTVRAGSQDPSALGECSVDLTDAGGKDLSLHLQFDDITLTNGSTPGAVGGLPLLVNGPDGNSCTATAVTSYTPGYGISVRVGYDGGDPCRAAQSGLQVVVQRLHDNPAKLPQPSGSLVAVDFCAIVDEGLVTNVLGRGSKSSVYGLHGCTWSGGLATAYLDYDIRLVPDARDGAAPVDLGGGVTGYQKLETGAGRQCTIDWLHRATGDGKGEVVSFKYDNFHDDAGNDDACGKAATVVKGLLPALPGA